MTIFQAIILGIIEGLTEFIPVSSTFHLIVASSFLGLPGSDFVKMFEVVIQSGAILALVILYAQTLLVNRKLLQQTLISFFPTALTGLFLYGFIKQTLFEQPLLMLFVFLLMGGIFFYLEHLVSVKKIILRRKLDQLNGHEPLLFGLAQSVSIIPGVSRSGSVMVAMMARGFTRVESARYSFLLSIPTILAAGSYDLVQNWALLENSRDQLSVLLTGFVVAFVSAYLVVKWFLRFLENHTLRAFAWYRLGVSGTLLLLLLPYLLD